jgi:hypothetical protein
MHKPDQAHFKIQGMGEISFRPACTITLPDGSHFKTPSRYATDNIQDLGLYEALNIHPVPTNVSLRMLATSIEQTPTIGLSFDDMSIPLLEDLCLVAYYPKNAILFLIRFFSIIMVIIIIIARLSAIANASKTTNITNEEHHTAQLTRRTRWMT